MSSAEGIPEENQPKLSNRGNKLSGEENPGTVRPKMWTNKRSCSEIINETDDFETFEKMFLRKVKHNSNVNEDSSVPFVRFLNEFEAQKSLFSKEGIELEKIFKEENLAKRPLSRYTVRALQSRHLEVLVTLLMLKIEEEQEEYRKLMRLAEELCIEDFAKGESGDVMENDANGVEIVFKKETAGLEGVDEEEVLKLKALCHEHLHLKRVYISTLRKIRSGAVYSLFQANSIYQKLHRLDRKLALIRPTEDENSFAEPEENEDQDQEVGVDEIAKELGSISDFRTSVNSLDQLFFEIVNGSKGTGSTVLKKLLSLYRSAGPQPSDLITWNLRRFSLAYAALSLTVPELFDGNSGDGFDELIEILLKRNPNVYATFFEDLADNLSGDVETFDAVLNGICCAVIARILSAKGEDKLMEMTTEIPNLILSILGPICRVGKINEFLMERSGFFSSEICDPIEASRKSIVGAIWTGMAVDAPGNFEAMQSLLPAGYGPPLPQPILMTAFQSLRDTLEMVTTSLQDNFLLPLIKGNLNHRQVVLKHLAALAKVNANRAKLQADPSTINSDGFVMGAFGILLKLCDPFTLAGETVRKSKIPLIDINFIYKNDLLDWNEVSRAGMDPQEYESSIPAVSATPANFITQIFFLSMQFFRLGPLRLIQEYGTTSREFVEIEQELKRLEESRSMWSSQPNAPMILRFIEKIKGRMRELVDIRISHDFHLMNPITKKSTVALISFFLALYKTQPDVVKRAMPEFFLENVWEYLLFMSKVEGNLSAVNNSEQDEILELAAELVPSAEMIKNPYIRAKQVEIFFALVVNDEERGSLVFSGLDRRVHRLLVGNMMKFYVQVESLGTSTAFYDKFSIRYHLTKVLLKILSFDSVSFSQVHKELDDATFVRFINLCVSDSTYLLDESLSKLAEIREKQIQMQTTPLTAEEQKLLSQTERQCQSLLSLGNESLNFLAKLTVAIPGAFLRPEILDRLTAMLNFNLVLLAGPRCSKLKVNNPSKYNFNPRALLASLIEIYLSLGGEETFLRSVAADERSFSPQLFDSCVGIMKRTGMSQEMVESFTTLSNKIITLSGVGAGAKDSDTLSVDPESIPDEYLDPILFNLMVDPVRLPASHMIVDRATIQAHLLNDPHDPFNRQPLRIEDVEPMLELKAEIESFLKSQNK